MIRAFEPWKLYTARLSNARRTNSGEALLGIETSAQQQDSTTEGSTNSGEALLGIETKHSARQGVNRTAPIQVKPS